MRLYYLTRWNYLKIKFNNRFGKQLNQHKIKKLTKKLHRRNKELDRRKAKIEKVNKRYNNWLAKSSQVDRELTKELQNAYLRDSMEKMREEGRI